MAGYGDTYHGSDGAGVASGSCDGSGGSQERIRGAGGSLAFDTNVRWRRSLAA